jgi:hypothetical protein
MTNSIQSHLQCENELSNDDEESIECVGPDHARSEESFWDIHEFDWNEKSF